MVYLPSDELNFTDHLRQFFNDEVTDDELRSLAIHAIASDVRRLKPAIAQAVWDSRQHAALGADVGTAERTSEGVASSTPGTSRSSNRLFEARQLHAMYIRALENFKQITDSQTPEGAVAGHLETDGKVDGGGDSNGSGEHQ